MHDLETLACLGSKNTLGSSAERPQNNSPEWFSSGGADGRQGQNGNFPQCNHTVKMLPEVWARRDKEVGAGFIGIGVTGKKILQEFCQGPFCKKTKTPFSILFMNFQNSYQFVEKS